ncbi:DNA polymerase-3 subunit delta' [Parasphingorhabdus marina DSM 22363]|uniref:DNA polymerase-3 subunit delta n=1 Tax=Parasphingorhabdus marina DSM 22363 TaxID=1123272 RepID=A0A1N6FPZ1_9SPHN|nr:DNA polymerase-3 subunit delta' [Parasphingorhabdus marina DSM 22363]
MGHDQAKRVFASAFEKGTLHHAWILAGPKGLGKAGFARQAAQFLLESDRHSPAPSNRLEIDAESQAARLLAAGSHPDFRLLQRGGKSDKEDKKARESGIESLEAHELKRNISIDQVRSLQSLFNTQASIASHRVVIIDAIDDLERGGANALLKNLEEPPLKTVFLLVSHTPERLLPTIRSRCQILRFEPLDDAQMREVLQQLAPDLDNPETEALIRAGKGAPGRALQYVDAGLAELEQLAMQILESGDPDNRIRNDLARKLSLKAATARYHAFLDLVPGLVADHVRSNRDSDRIRAIETWQEICDLAGMAVPKALDSQAVIFRLASMMGSLALRREPA